MRKRPDLWRKSSDIVVYCLTDLRLNPDTKYVWQDRSNWTKKIYRALLKVSK